MKKIAILIVGILVSSIALSQDCNIGNQDTIGFNATSGEFQADYLLGIKFPLSSNGTLHSLNFIGKNTGAQVQMAVYDDNNGVPDNLIVSSGTTTVGSGIISLPVAPTLLDPGDYWIMAIYDFSALHAFKTNDSPGTIVYYQSLVFGSPIPNNASSFLTYSGHNFAYFMEIECGAVGLSESQLEDAVVLWPNPATDIISIRAEVQFERMRILDMSGQVMRDYPEGLEPTDIDISTFPKGMYSLVLDFDNEVVVKRFLKN